MSFKNIATNAVVIDGLPVGASSAAVEKFFKPLPIHSIHPWGCAEVEFGSKEAVQLARQALGRHKLGGRRVKGPAFGNRLVVNLPELTHDRTIREMFQGIPIIGIHPRGAALVLFATSRDAECALSRNHGVVRGNLVEVTRPFQRKAEPKKKRKVGKRGSSEGSAKDARPRKPSKKKAKRRAK
eukprot:RCo049505